MWKERIVACGDGSRFNNEGSSIRSVLQQTSRVRHRLPKHGMKSLMLTSHELT